MEKKENKNIEREYTIPLRARWMIVPRYKRTSKAVRTVKEFLVQHMKIRDRDLDKIRVDKYLNEVLWARGIKHPPAKIKVRAVKEGEIVRVYLAEVPNDIKFKQLREEKKEKSAKEVMKKKKKVEKEEVAEEPANPEMKEIAKETEEKKKEFEEKKESTIIAEEKFEKIKANEQKHTTKAQSPKQEKNAQVGYNKSSRGH